MCVWISQWHLVEKLCYTVLPVLKPLFEAYILEEAYIFNMSFIELEISDKICASSWLITKIKKVYMKFTCSVSGCKAVHHTRFHVLEDLHKL